MFIDAQPLLGMGAYLSDEKLIQASNYNATAANTKWTTPHARELANTFTSDAFAKMVAVYQKKKGLTLDGKLGPATARSIESATKNVQTGYDNNGEVKTDVVAVINDVWVPAFENDEVVSDDAFNKGLTLFHNFKAKTLAPSPRPTPSPLPLPRPYPAPQMDTQPLYLAAGAVLLFLAYRSFTGKPLNPFK